MNVSRRSWALLALSLVVGVSLGYLLLDLQTARTPATNSDEEGGSVPAAREGRVEQGKGGGEAAGRAAPRASWESTPQNTPPPEDPYATPAYKLDPPRPAGEALPPPVEPERPPHEYRPPMNSPGGVVGTRPPREIRGTGTKEPVSRP